MRCWCTSYHLPPLETELQPDSTDPMLCLRLLSLFSLPLRLSRAPVALFIGARPGLPRGLERRHRRLRYQPPRYHSWQTRTKPIRRTRRTVHHLYNSTASWACGSPNLRYGLRVSFGLITDAWDAWVDFVLGKIQQTAPKKNPATASATATVALVDA